MTSDELTDELVRVAAIVAPHEREVELAALKRASGVGIGALRDSLRLIMRAQLEAAEQQRRDPVMTRLNEDGWFMLLDNGKVWAARLVTSRLNGHSVRKLDCLTVPDFCTWVHHFDPDSSVEDSPGKVWTRDPDTPRYDGTTIDPDAGLNANGRLNLWRGFGVTPEPNAEALDTFEAHVLKVCSGDDKAAKYMMDWIAWGFQNPSKQIGTAIVLIGDPGSGKGMIGNLLSGIWGSHGLALRDKRSIVGDFNAHLTECAFAFVDEALFSGDRQTADKIKGLITEPTLMTEAKFKNRAETTNMLKMMMASNHDHAIQVDPKDRRFAVIKVPENMPPSDSPYWKQFYRICHSITGKAGILSHMLHRDITGFIPEAERPVTEGYIDQKRASLTHDLQFWRQVSQQGTLNPGERYEDHMVIGDWPTRVSQGAIDKDRLYQFYSRWHARNERFSPPIDKRQFYKTAKAVGITTGRNVRPKPSGDQPRPRQIELMSFDEMEENLTHFLTVGKALTDQ